MTTTLLNNAPASSFRAVPPEGRRWPCAAATIRAGDQQVIISPDSARAAESSLGWDETAGLLRTRVNLQQVSSVTRVKRIDRPGSTASASSKGTHSLQP